MMKVILSLALILALSSTVPETQAPNGLECNSCSTPDCDTGRYSHPNDNYNSHPDDHSCHPDNHSCHPDDHSCHPGVHSCHPDNHSCHPGVHSCHPDDHSCHPGVHSCHPDNHSCHPDDHSCHPDKHSCHPGVHSCHPDNHSCHPGVHSCRPDNHNWRLINLVNCCQLRQSPSVFIGHHRVLCAVLSVRWTPSGSVDAAVKRAASLHCSDTDGCNNQNISYPDLQTENGLQCFTCADPHRPACHTSVRRVTKQDRSMSGRGERSRCTLIRQNASFCRPQWGVEGPPSRSLAACLQTPVKLSEWAAFIIYHFNFISPPTCCKTSFSAWILKLSAAPLLLGLFGLVVCYIMQFFLSSGPLTSCTLSCCCCNVNFPHCGIDKVYLQGSNQEQNVTELRGKRQKIKQFEAQTSEPQ
ncbi:uncharacterized protein LOC143318707 [Chaetodon auriga]|uniref:uncharacterized protein LOC143318707 n=1 Tax=Chaetodon auriga TaxID=39042 RepID=UPI0040331516